MSLIERLEDSGTVCPLFSGVERGWKGEARISTSGYIEVVFGLIAHHPTNLWKVNIFNPKEKEDEICEAEYALSSKLLPSKIGFTPATQLDCPLLTLRMISSLHKAETKKRDKTANMDLIFFVNPARD